jgi:hypothetical protein
MMRFMSRAFPSRRRAEGSALSLLSVLFGRAILALGIWAGAGLVPVASAADGKLLLTGGVSTIDGAAGGGLVPWAVTGSYATAGQWGATASLTQVATQDYRLAVAGAAFSLNDRLEMSLAAQDLDTGSNLAALGLAGLHLRQTIVGLKLRLCGDAVLDSDRWQPQLALGVLHKQADSGALAPTLTGALGAREAGTEVYLSATKLLLAQGLLLNLNLRATQANQGGLMGFGGAQAGSARVHPELSVAWLLNRHVAAGVEMRTKPDNLRHSVLGEGALREDAWADAFVAWAPGKSLSLTLAWVDLGAIVPALQPRRQSGAYLSVQIAQ